MKRLLILVLLVFAGLANGSANTVFTSVIQNEQPEGNLLQKKKKKNKRVHRKFGRIGMHHPKRSSN